MVSPSCYSDGRRYSRLEPPYVYSDRQHRYSSTSEARTSTMTEREPETDTPPRKRIAVACGRCRKRKIRCSGDAGNGMPCQNCKAAGIDACHFLRVASQEAPWVQPSDPGFSYELKAARAYQAVGGHALAASPTHYASEMHDGLPRAPQHGGYPPSTAGYSSYGTTGKYYSSMPASWTSPAAYPADDGTGVDYSAMGYPSYPYHSQDASYLYRMTAAKAPSNADLYVNTDGTGYGYSSSGAALVHRPAAAGGVSPADAPNFSLSNAAASLPHTTSGGDRLLPNPSRLPTANVLAYRTDGSAASSSYATSTKSTGSGSSNNPSPTSAVSEVTTSYDASPVSAYPPAPHTLPSMTHIHHHHHHQQQHRLSNANADMAGYPSSTSSADAIFTPSETSLRTHGSASELSYKYSDASPTGSSGRRGSGGTSASSGSTGSGGGSGSLANGQTYTVPTPGSAMYAASMGHSRHHVGAYALLSDDVDQQQQQQQQHPHYGHREHHHQHQQQHPSGRRSAGSLSAS
ncbi:transcriptional regulatory protein C2H10.01 [Colletotrichum kahawae]|uniref:Transcriptional regulatory protein C2H10.01 n=1 Tax=Colletotrichum kahawae TaxID=34407 RepID=A0AAD9XYD9_COLKA|nr:transcriptional regulatory protein C2H10.01 [Colletotrichum kahawae]